MRQIQPVAATPGVDWLADFGESLVQADLSPKTVKGYREDLRLFWQWLSTSKGPGETLSRLSALDLMNYRQHLVNVERKKAATVNRRLHALRKFCRWAQQCGKIKTDPSLEVKPLRTAPRRQPKGMVEREVHALLRAAGESKRGLAKRNYAIVQLLIQAGLRVGEVAGLVVADVVLRDRTGSVRVRQGKGRKEREVPLNATARRALRIYLDVREGVKPEDPLFASREGGPISIRSLQTLLAELARRAKITRLKVSAHTARHTFALNYLKENPGKLVELAALLGHDSLDTTAIYTRASQEDLALDLEKSRLNVYDG